jgi:hypothetical protein
MVGGWDSFNILHNSMYFRGEVSDVYDFFMIATKYIILLYSAGEYNSALNTMYPRVAYTRCSVSVVQGRRCSVTTT